MSSTKLSKEDILQKVGSYKILNHYLSSYHNFGELRQGQHISNPFLHPNKQETPSFNIFCTGLGNHEWRYKDFATGDVGSCFDLVMRLFCLDFKETLKKICKDFNLLSREVNDLNEGGKSPLKEIIINQNTRIFIRDFSANELSYWGDYKIGFNHLKKFRVNAVEKYSFVSKFNKPYEIRSKAHSPIFSYTINQEAFKIYKPLEKKCRFLYLGNKPKDYVFGYDLLPESGEVVLFTGGEKDVICLYSQGYSAVSLNSETAMPSESLIRDLKSRFDKVAILYDADETGIKQAQKISTRFNLPVITLTKYS